MLLPRFNNFALPAAFKKIGANHEKSKNKKGASARAEEPIIKSNRKEQKNKPSQL